jgi:hypothetical protein
MVLVIAIVVAAIAIGILSVIVKGLLWLLAVALLLVVVAFVVGRLRGGSRPTDGAGI